MCPKYIAGQSTSVATRLQAMLDFKYLNDRYVKGKARVSAFLDDKHRLQNHDNLIMGHSAIVEMQAAMGDKGFLDFFGMFRIV